MRKVNTTVDKSINFGSSEKYNLISFQIIVYKFDFTSLHFFQTFI
jgi:hypothetical protein